MERQELHKSQDCVGKRVAAVVVTHKRRGSLEQVLAAIQNQTRPLDEIILVDNANRPATKAVISRSFPEITYYPQSDNLGSAGGHSAGMRLACEHGHDWIWLMDDDAIPESCTLENCLRVAESLEGTKLALVSPARVGNGKMFGFGSLWRGRALPVPDRVRNASWYEVDISGSIGALLSRKAVEHVGYPRADFFMQYWETEYSLRFLAAGYRIVKIPVPYVTHADDSQGPSVPWRDSYYGARNWLAMALEHRSAVEVFWWTVYQLKAMGATILYGDNKLERLRFRLIGTWHGLRHKMGKTIDPAEYSNRKPTV